MKFHQLLVFQQGDGHLFGLYVYYEFACHYKNAFKNYKL